LIISLVIIIIIVVWFVSGVKVKLWQRVASVMGRDKDAQGMMTNLSEADC
jgi:hypothetical protein